MPLFSTEDKAPFDGPLKMAGGAESTSSPHRCPYQPDGASNEICDDFTGNYQRNLAGCCGTQDNRAFPPCNSVRRKCFRCLAEGKGSQAQNVLDPKRGLCEEHQSSADQAKLKPKVQPQHHRSRFALQESITYPKTALRPPMVKPAPVVKPALVVVKRVATAKPTQVATKPPVKENTPVKTAEVTSPVTIVSVSSDSVLAELCPKPIIAPGFDLDTSATRASKLSARNVEIIEGVLGNRKVEGLTKASLAALVSGICTKLDIPKSGRFKPYDRIGALKVIWNRYKELVAEGKLQITPPAPPTTPRIKSPLGRRLLIQRQEREVLSLFRQCKPEERSLILEYIESLKNRR